MVIAVVLAFVGLGRLWLGHPRSGAWMLTLAAFITAAPLLVLGPELRLADPILVGTHSIWYPHLPLLIRDSVFVATLIAALCAIGWIKSQRLRGLPVEPSAWIAAGIALSLMGVALIFTTEVAERLSEETINELPFPRIGHEPTRPLIWLALLWGAGLVLSLMRPLYVSRFVSLLVLLVGASSVAPALAVAHDGEIEPHDIGMTVPPFEFKTPTASSCGPVQWAPVVGISRTEVIVSGLPLAKANDVAAIDAALFENLAKQRARAIELHAQAGDSTPEEFAVNLVADEGTPLAAIAAIGRAAHRAQYDVIYLIAMMPSPGRTWTAPTVHNHSCAIRVELSPGGTPIATFADFPSLFRAAEESRGTLRVQISP